MAKQERTILVCDACGADEGDGNGPVTTHQLRVDGTSWWLEACEACWRSVYRDRVKALTAGVRRTRVPARATRRRGLRAVS
jgi:hypothetical protein